MTSLILTIAVLIAVYFVQTGHPFIAGLVAVIPVKIVATGFMAFETGGKDHFVHALDGMLAGQWAWAVILTMIWVLIR